MTPVRMRPRLFFLAVILLVHMLLRPASADDPGGSGVDDPCSLDPYSSDCSSSMTTSSPASAPTAGPTITGLNCLAGEYQDVEANVCMPCPSPRTYSVAGSVRVESCKCPAGKWFDTKGGTVCVACYPNYRNDAMTDTEVRPQGVLATRCCLRLGVFANPPLPSQCAVCSLGTKANLEGTDCEECGLGHYGRSSNPGVCTTCPGNSTTFSTTATGDTDNDACSCYAGYRNEFGVGELPVDLGSNNLNCKLCPSGRYGTDCGGACPNGQTTHATPPVGSAQCVSCAQGKYSQHTDSWIGSGVSYAITCTDCVDPLKTTVGSETHWWGEGPLPCACQAGYTPNAADSCEACPSGKVRVCVRSDDYSLRSSPADP